MYIFACFCLSIFWQIPRLIFQNILIHSHDLELSFDDPKYRTLCLFTKLCISIDNNPIQNEQVLTTIKSTKTTTCKKFGINIFFFSRSVNKRKDNKIAKKIDIYLYMYIYREKPRESERERVRERERTSRNYLIERSSPIFQYML